MSKANDVYAALQTIPESDWERPIESAEDRATVERILAACRVKTLPSLPAPRREGTPTDPHWRDREH